MEDLYKSTHKYTSHQRHTLSFEANVLFSVVSKNQDSWWVGGMKRLQGHVFHMLLFTGEQPSVVFCVVFGCNT